MVLKLLVCKLGKMLVLQWLVCLMIVQWMVYLMVLWLFEGKKLNSKPIPLSELFAADTVVLLLHQAQQQEIDSRWRCFFVLLSVGYYSAQRD